MLYVAPGASFEAVAYGLTSGLTGTARARILDNAGATVYGPSTAGVTEYPAGSGVYAVTLTAPTTAGQYSVLFDTGALGPTTTKLERIVVTSSGAVGAVPSGSDLTTLAAVRSYLQKETSDTEQDAEIQALITAYSRVMMREFRREWAPATAAATRTVAVFPEAGTERGWLVSLEPYELRSVSQMRLHPESSSPITLAAGTDYLLEPLGAPDGTYLRVLLADGVNVEGSTLWASFGFAQLEIAGAWGHASVPVDVDRACVLAVFTAMRRDVQSISATWLADEGRVERPEALPMAVMRQLAAWRRWDD